MHALRRSRRPSFKECRRSLLQKAVRAAWDWWKTICWQNASRSKAPIDECRPRHGVSAVALTGDPSETINEVVH